MFVFFGEDDGSAMGSVGVEPDLVGLTYLRVSLMNPLTTITDLQDLLREIKTIA